VEKDLPSKWTQNQVDVAIWISDKADSRQIQSEDTMKEIHINKGNNPPRGN
jgi:hypothetical protein